MYDSLWENHPKVKELYAELAAAKAQARIEGRTEGKAKRKAKKKDKEETEGRIEGLRYAIVTFVRIRYPALTEMAQQKVAHLNSPDTLEYVLEHLYVQCDEKGVRAFLIPTWREQNDTK